MRGCTLIGLSAWMASGCAEQVAFDVTTTADIVDANPGDGECAAASGGCSLRAAIQEVNAQPAGGSYLIRLLNAGTYQLSLDLNPKEGLVLEPPLKRVEIVGCCSSPSLTTIEQTLASRIFTIRGNALTIERVRLVGGHAPDAPLDPGTVKDGGAIHVSGAGATLQVQDSILEENTAEQQGGAIFVADDGSAQLLIERSIIRNNSAAVAGVGGAGGVHSGGATFITDTLFQGNLGNGGGLRIEDASGVGGVVMHEVLRSTFYNNQSPNSGGGGGLRVDIGNDELIVSGCTFSQNTTEGTTGGAIGIVSGTVEVRETTMTRNAAGVTSPNATGGQAVLVGQDSQLRLYSTLIAQNPSTNVGDVGQIGCSASAVVILEGFNLIDGILGNCPLVDDNPSDGDDVGEDGPIDARLSFYTELPIGHHPLHPDSPAIDHGAFFCEGEDQIGNPKPVNGDGDDIARCDAGSIEYQGGP